MLYFLLISSATLVHVAMDRLIYTSQGSKVVLMEVYMIIRYDYY